MKEDDASYLGMSLESLLQEKEELDPPVDVAAAGEAPAAPEPAAPEVAGPPQEEVPPPDTDPLSSPPDAQAPLKEEAADLLKQLSVYSPGDLVAGMEIQESCELLLNREDLSAEQKSFVEKVRTLVERICQGEEDDEPQRVKFPEQMLHLFDVDSLADDGSSIIPDGNKPVVPDDNKSTVLIEDPASILVAEDVLHSFIQESHDHLDNIEGQILKLESEPTPDLVNGIFRSIHTIKGTSSFLGLTRINTLSHALESVLDDLREERIAVSTDLADVLLEGTDLLIKMIRHLDQASHGVEARGGKIEISDSDFDITDVLGGLEQLRTALAIAPTAPEPVPEPKNKPILDLVTPEMVEKFFSETSESLDSGEKAILELEQRPEDRTILDSIFRIVHTIKGNAGFLGYERIEKVCMDTESVLDSVRREEKTVDSQTINLLLHTVDTLRQLLDSVSSSDGGADQPEKQLGEILVEMGAVTPDAIDEALGAQERKLGEILVAEGMVEEKVLQEALKQQKPGTAVARSDSYYSVSRKDIRVDMNRLDKLLDLMGELITAESMVIDHPAVKELTEEGVGKAVNYLSKISREMQEITMTLRMIPLEGLFNKMNRLVRDLSRKFGKKINFEISGQETEMDRNVIEVIADPLVHIIRNAIDHGLEAPGKRQELGKADTGSVILSARYEGNEIWISVSDDGAGLDRSKILERAEQRGLLKKESQDLMDHEVWALIFEPGFSTAETVSEISGRGVGMDVVKKNLDRLRGRVDIHSTHHEGTEIILKIPLTLAIIDGVFAQLGTMLLTIPIGDILEFHQTEGSRITRTEGNNEVLKLRKDIIPIIRLHEFFGLENEAGKTGEGILVIVLAGGRKAALLTDDILGYRQIVVKALPEHIDHVRAISGCSLLGNGEVSLILDTGSLLKEVLE